MIKSLGPGLDSLDFLRIALGNQHLFIVIQNSNLSKPLVLTWPQLLQQIQAQLNINANNGINVQDEGSVIQSAAQFLNFIGGGVTVTPSATGVDIVIPGGGSAAEWGSIGAGTGVGSQADLVAYLTSNYQPIGNYVPTSRNLTINGVTYDLSADRSWTITSGVYTADNGLTMLSNNVALGSASSPGAPLLNDRYIDTGATSIGLRLTGQKTNGNDFILYIDNSASGGGGIDAQTTGAGVSIRGRSQDSAGVLGSSVTSSGVQGQTSATGQGGVLAAVASAASNIIALGLRVRHTTSAAPAPGFGVSIQFAGETTTIFERLLGRLMYQWTDAVDATRTSKFQVETVDNATPSVNLEVLGSGQLILNEYTTSTSFASGLTSVGVLNVDNTGKVFVTAGGGGGGGVSSVSAGTGMSFVTITSSGSVDIDTTKVPYLPTGFSIGLLKWSGSAWVFDNTTYQPQLNGTGFVKASGTTITYDNSTYVPTSRQVATTNSLTGGGDLSADRTLSLVNDQASPGANKVYGTDSSGTKGWKADPSGGGGILHATASGTNTYTATIAGVTAYNDGDAYLIRFTNGNDVASPTLNINSIGAINLYRNNDGQLLGGDISNGGEMLCVYNSSLNVFQCIGTSPNSLFAYVTNVDTVAITKGMPVVAWGGTGDRMTVQRAYNTDDAHSAQTIGLVYSSSIGVNQKGFIMIQGLLDGLNTLPTATWNDGDPVFLGSSAGTITPTKPYAPNHLVYLGFVTTANNGFAGRMYVKVQNGYELDELHNVQATSPTYKDTLWYDNVTTPLKPQWKTASIATILGYTPLSQTLANTNIFVGNASNIATAVAMSGDATLANTGALTISNNAVTYAKMQNVSTTSRLLGSSSTTTPVQEIILGTGLSMSGNTLNGTSSSNSIGELTGDVTAGPASSPSQSVAATVKANLKVGSCGVTFDGGGQVVQNKTAYVQMPYNGTLTSWSMVADQGGNCTITVSKGTFTGFPTFSTVYATAPAITSPNQKASVALPTYNAGMATVTAGDVLKFDISGVSTITWVNLSISITKT